ncbi:MAG TPA: phosphomannomutase/phosphoglucomutase [Candidatus Deferrimicrobium sp.]|nr:phosphomannomutase/phosphoglucomutase [Candidatus Deferrimicrobium sp.]
MAIAPINPLIFREYDVRGLVGRDLHRAAVVLLGKGYATLAAADGVRTVALGRDCRLSSPGFRDAIAEGLLSAGLKVIDVGVCPTPLLYFAIHHFGADGGVMITGSHNPPEFNGFKLCVGTGTLYGERIQELRRVIERGTFREGKGDIVSREIIPEYRKFVAGNLSIPRKLKVVVDAGNGTAGAVAPALFREMGMEVTELFCDPDGRFPNHFPDPTVPENLRFLVEKVRAIGADVGVGYDGDADRIGAVDEKGNVIYGDYLLVLFAREILSRKPGAAIISEVKSSQNLYDDIARHGGRPVMWKAGHSLIKAKMKEENAELAGEMSGHVFFRDRYLGFDDAIYASARLFEILAKERRPLSALLSDLPPVVSTPEIRVDCPDEIKFRVVEEVARIVAPQAREVIDVDGIRALFDGGWGLVRASNTQPVLVLRFEGRDEAAVRRIRGVMEEAVARARAAVRA